MRKLLRSLTIAVTSSMTARRPLWVDTDAGFDDLVALSALATEQRLAMVSCTSGACETPEAGAGRVRQAG